NLKAKFISQLYDECSIDGEIVETDFDILKSSPNPLLTWEQLKFLTLWWAYQTGNAYIYAPIQNGKPFGMYVLPSTSIKVVADGDIIKRYEYRNGTDSRNYDPEEIIHFKRMFPSSTF